MDANNGAEYNADFPRGMGSLKREFSALGDLDPKAEDAPRKLAGASPIDYARREIPEEEILLGNRYLCRGGGLIIAAPSGCGKSVLAVQCAILWSAGLAAIGIRPTRPLRCLVVQAEDDRGDIIEMTRMVNYLGLTKEQRGLVEQNCHLEFVNDLTGDAFLDCLGGFLEQRPFDLVFLNPYTAYLGADIKEDKANSHFLRNRLNPLLSQHRAGAVIIHHTPKTNHRDTTNWRATDWMYAGAGAAVLTNWARAYLVLEPTDIAGVYRFIAAKREKRTGWDEPELLFAHSNDEDKLLWVPANREQIALAKTAKKKPEDLLELIPMIDPILQEQLFEDAQKHGFGADRKVRGILKILLNDSKIYKHKMPRDRVRGAVGYSKSPPCTAGED